MGMYDDINGEQVKCFSYVHYYEDKFSNDNVYYICGKLKSYGNGNRIPFKTLSYNYTRNFIILLVKPFQFFTDNENINFCIHVIKDAKVSGTYYSNDEIPDNIFDDNNMVIDYYGSKLNIKCKEDIYDYAKQLNKRIEKIDKISEKANDIFAKQLDYFWGIGTLAPDSEEKKERLKNIDILSKQYHEELDIIQPELDKINTSFSDRWLIEEENMQEIRFGEYLECGLFQENEIKNNPRENSNLYLTKIVEILKVLIKNNPNIYKSFVKWSDMTPQKKKEVNDFLKKYNLK